jgi:hypothetical protein
MLSVLMNVGTAVTLPVYFIFFSGMAFSVGFFQINTHSLYISLRGSQIPVTKHLLNGHYISPVFNQHGGKGMAKNMSADFFRKFCLSALALVYPQHFTLQIGIINRQIAEFGKPYAG